tara:strand:- start:263 stop:439 length:177 start_codon:yes stop_codon:yes gene_type:complete
MAREIQVSDAELEAVVARALAQIDRGDTEYEDGTYEEGLVDGIRWLLGVTSKPPGSED